MKRIITLLFSLVYFLSLTNAQILKGKITDPSGKPVGYATVYITELRQGTTSNTRGDYEIRLPIGRYTVVYQSLGYQPVYASIALSSETITKDVVLPMQYYQIPEVRVSATGEDPAYGIMRKAIGVAPYYLNNVSSYKAEVYLKGDLVINKIPRLLQKSMKMESSGNESSVSAGSKQKGNEKLLKAGDSFFMESVNDIEFTAPDKYIQKVISYNSTFPAQGNEISPMTFIQASFYQPVLADMAISPLSPNAFSYYKFKYLGASTQGNYTINKIQVIPKRKSQQVFEGTIYIIEDLWCLQSVDLVNENFFGKIRVQQLYIPVLDDIWMPVSHKFEIIVNIIGFKADIGYGSSVKYTEVKPNLSLLRPATLSADNNPPAGTSHVTTDTGISKSGKQINSILEKDHLSNRDMARLAKLMQKETESDSSKKSLEINENTKQIVEKGANRRDTAYWNQIRPIPLSVIEMKSLRISDSIKARKALTDSIPGDKKQEKNKFIKTMHDIAFGYSITDTSRFRFSGDGLINLKNLGFNTVDGFVYGLNFEISKSWKNKGSFYFIPDIRWAFSREKLMWGLNTGYNFDKVRHRQIFIRTGVKSKDINNGGGINPFLNSLTSLLLKANYLKLYQSGYFDLGYSGEIANGLTLKLSAEYEDRQVLKNTSSFSLIRYSMPYSENIPENTYLAAGSNSINALHNMKHYEFQATLSYTPFQKYRMIKGAKVSAGSDWPTFELTWQHGVNVFNDIQQVTRNLDMFRFEAYRSSSIGAFSYFKWRLRTAGFIDNRSATFFDFFHINSQPFPLLINNYEDAFVIPSYYSLCTPEFFVEAHIKYTTPYLLLKLLPVMSNTLIRENLNLSFLASRFQQGYTEIGYSLSEIFLVGELGIYAGFDNFTYRSAGLRAVLSFH